MTFAFIAKAVLPFVYPVFKANQIEKETSQLSKIFGDKVTICAGDNDKNYFVTTYEKLGKEQKNKFLAKYELPANSNKKADNYILASGFSIVLKLTEAVLLKSDNNLISKNYLSSLKLSRAPPALA
ncbi:MAG TPA: hypothetical protein DIV86_02210 [Alphaproteobacteria bacterium]|nr:hypothetical protein [Alphaproteobacteria bacterium]